jgi:hypothetical protein
MAFAENFSVLTRGTYKIEAQNYANQDLKKTERWVAVNKIEFNDKKAKVLLLSRKRNDREVNIQLNYKRLDQNEEMKYLEIYLDSKFNFLDFKLSPCSVCCMLSFGQFPGVWSLYDDVSEHSVCFIFIGR